MNEKNDLMQNIGGSENNNLRKYLILGGGVFVLFVVGIVIAKFMFSSPKKDNTQVILADNMKADTTANTKDTKLFNDIPIENDANTNTNQNNNATTFKKPEETTSNMPTQQTQSKNVEVTPIKKETPKVQEVATPTTKKEITKVVTPKKSNIKKEYYLQVAAVTRGKPSARFLKLIKKNGFNYKIMKANIKGMTVRRVLVGPFTYKEAKQALPKVRQKISSSAFIKRVK